MRDLLDEDTRWTTQILAVSPDDIEGAQKMVDRVTAEAGGPPGFPLLADPHLSVISRYGVFNPEPFNGQPVPHPAVYVIDRTGTVTWKFLNTDARIRAENKDILAAIAQLTNE